MPNLDYDVQNPSDLLGRPIAEGDVVAWGTTFGKSPAIAVCRIRKIRYLRKSHNGTRGRARVWEECDRRLAEEYQLVLLPLKSTGSVTITSDEFHPDGFIDPDTNELACYPDGTLKKFKRAELSEPKLKTIKLVKNVVKLEPIE